MESPRLSEAERRYFGELFAHCDRRDDGSVPLLKATELLRAAGLEERTLRRVADLCFEAGATHVDRRQFYSALKLVAAHQADLPLGEALLQEAVTLPLPRFALAGDADEEPGRPRPARRYEPMGSSDVELAPSTDLVDDETLSLDSEPSYAARGDDRSPWSTASESPTPTNSAAERRAQVPPGPWPGRPAGEEHTRLLGTEEESSDRHSSEEDGGETDGEGGAAWAVGPEQRRHYDELFELLLPGPDGLVPGRVARRFFDKSRLPASDLRKIWLLSDATGDDALCADEFAAAMHLIVLRRKDVPVPDALPARLAPPRRAPVETLVDLGGPADPDPAPVARAEPERPPSPRADGASPPDRPRPRPEWTKFVDSPTSGASSPGPEPVNFDFRKSAVERDPEIFHPVPLRATPETGPDPGGSSPRRAEDAASPKRSGDPGPDIRPIQRPQARKAAPKAAGALPPPPAREPSASADEPSGPASLQCPPKKEPPPPPPPRPARAHARSSSLDLNRLKGGPPPQVPPRVSPSASNRCGDAEADAFADFSRLAASPDDDAPRRRGAFEVYRKPTPRAPDSPPPHADALRALQERNALLCRLCRELSVELADAQRERETLRLRLESAPPV